MWRLRFTPAEEAYLEAKGAEVLNERTDPDNLLAWQAYADLRMSRPAGFGLSPIPVSEVASYCDLIGLTDAAQRARLLRFILAMDRSERDHLNGNSPA